MKANLSSMEPRMLDKWEEMALYKRIREAREGRPTFVLHDGPPYANGHIHLGHALNKILKDLIVKSKTMEGYQAPYLPGWDCHGLPIEIKVMARKQAHRDPLAIRRECRQYASKYVEIQEREFKRLGVFGEWDRPYLTMAHRYEAETARLLGVFIEKESVYKGLKPVHWCISCETALAEAEVAYKERTSLSVYVKFPLRSGSSTLGSPFEGVPIFALIWTTTPWTLPANLAICFHPDFEYSLVEVGKEVLIIASGLLEQVARECQFESYRVLRRVSGKDLRGLVFGHPWLDRESKTLLGAHVTLEQGTGAVHTAPGHGEEDYLMGIEHGLDIYNPVDGAGRFHSHVEHFAGIQVFEADRKISQFMAERGVLVAQRDIRHSYPHCWRCHNPVIFRATAQWFIKMDHAGFRKKAMQEIRGVDWIPAWGQERMESMIATRPDWCISRQRIWGVPIAVFYCRSCGEALLEKRVVDHVADLFEAEGADAWYARPVAELLPPGTACGCGETEFDKEFDILDVWFDSGASHHVVLGGRADLPWPADVYLEGGDQYRGWFQSSLLVAVGARNQAPYRTVICHGFTLDAQGRAMSKSVGNVISPLEIVRRDGAEILRLWVASINYTEDARLDQEVLARLREAYRKLRNTQRFLLGNLSDFNSSQAVPDSELEEIDRWALAFTAGVSHRVQQAYRRFEFHVVYHNLYNFCVVDLSSFYLDVLKDRLYVLAADSKSRRSAQTALFQISDTLVRLLAPILPFTSEEVWDHLHCGQEPFQSVHLAEFPGELDEHRNDPLLKRWERLRQIREEATRVLEESRQRKEIGHSLEAMVTLYGHPRTVAYLKSFPDLCGIFLVSKMALKEDSDLDQEETRIEISRAPGEKCERCWNYSTSVGSNPEIPSVCDRCHQVLRQMDRDSEFKTAGPA
ncbi:MAG: isoleucine--tRNA ligase [Acidobacteriota bacterium]